MKLYTKKLNSLEELKREKQVMKYAKKHTTSQGFFPLEKVTADNKRKTAEDEAPFNQSDILSILGDLMTSKSTASVLLSLGLPLIKLVGRKAEKNVFRTVGFEILGGYLKWKAIQFVFKRIKRSFADKDKSEHKKKKK